MQMVEVNCKLDKLANYCSRVAKRSTQPRGISCICAKERGVVGLPSSSQVPSTEQAIGANGKWRHELLLFFGRFSCFRIVTLIASRAQEPTSEALCH